MCEASRSEWHILNEAYCLSDQEWFQGDHYILPFLPWNDLKWNTTGFILLR